MRILNIRAFVLIAEVIISLKGIFGSTVTPGDSSSQKGLIEGIIELSHTPGSAYLNTSTNAEAIDKLLRESCEKNVQMYHHAAYETAKEGWQLFLDCRQSETNQMIFTAETRAARPHEDLLTILTTYCRMLPGERNCLNQLKDSIVPCLDPKEHEAVKIIYNAIKSFLEIICDGDAALVKKFVADGGEKCFHSKKEALLNCVNEISSSDGESVNMLQKLFATVSETKNCIDIENLHRCSLEVSTDCEHPTSIKIMVDHLLNSVKKAINCENVPKSQALPASVVNTLLTATVMAILLYPA